MPVFYSRAIFFGFGLYLVAQAAAARDGEAVAPAAPSLGASPAPAAKLAPEQARAQTLDALFKELRLADSPDDARRVAESIEQLWLQTYSPTAALLMKRVESAEQAGQRALALSLLDKVTAIEPYWAEAWNQRARVRYSTGDFDGAMADISRAIKLEPRHFGALAGMAAILESAGLDERALEIWKKILSIYPLEADVQKRINSLEAEIGGQEL